MTRSWFRQSLLALSLAVACAKATDEDLVNNGGDDGTGGSSGSSGKGTGGSSGFGGTPPTGGASGKGGATGGVAGTAGKGGASGKGGTVATGGSAMGGMGDGGEGPDACSVRGTPPDLRIDYKAGTKPVTLDPDGNFRLVNETAAAIPLSELTFRYWFHSEFTCEQTTSTWVTHVVAFQLDEPYAAKNVSDVRTSVVSLDTGDPGCDAYFELGFAATAGSLARNQVASIGYWAEMAVYDRPHDQANDYSYGACTMQFVYWDKITVYRNGRLVTGTPPGGGGEGGAGGEGGRGAGGI